MKNVPIRATGEAMHEINRRTFLSRLGLAGGGVALMALPATPAVPVAPAVMPIAPGADAELFRLAKALRAAIKASVKANDAANELQRLLRAGVPPEADCLKMSQEECEAFKAMTIGDMRHDRMPPLYQAFYERSKAHDAESKAARSLAEKTVHANPELKALRRVARRAYEARDRVGIEFWRTRAQTLEGLLLKTRFASECEWRGKGIEKELAKDLRALKRSGAYLAART